ncbi:MAG: gluconate 2-dehydrogenase subunit 3 family protein [Gammaproteobacteria bacterium]
MTLPVTRRTALKFVGLITLVATQGRLRAAAPGVAAGYGTNPDLLVPRATWPMVLEPAERAVITALCDLILPADGIHPSAREAGVPDFIDEWVSAPYPRMTADREVLASACVELERRARESHQMPFAGLPSAAQRAVFESLLEPAMPPRLRAFPAHVANLIAGGYYTTKAGYADMGYAGNVALERFPAPSEPVIRQIEAAVAELASR